MRPILITLLATGALAGATLTARIADRPAQAAPTSTEGRTPVIVELFTSEGCSSCPPADTLLSHLEKTQPIPGDEVIALGEHVDYWNHGGWADRFSSQAFSARQSDYSNAFRKDTVYTPQMIVDGRTEFVGSDDGLARNAITRAARQPKVQVSLTQTGSALAVRVGHLPALVGNDPTEVVLAITEDGLSSSVGGGENAGRRLVHSAVVRQLTVLGRVSGGVFTAAPSVKSFGGHGGNFHAVVFVQKHASRQIIGASEISLS
jgi:hypothetical protein